MIKDGLRPILKVGKTEKAMGAEMIVADFINPADSPNTTVAQVKVDMIDQGAKLIFATSDDMKDKYIRGSSCSSRNFNDLVYR